MFSFGETSYFWWWLILIPIVWIFSLALKRKRKIAAKIGDEKLVQKLTRNYAPAQYKRKFQLILITFFIGILAIVNIRMVSNNADAKLHGVDVMVALDVSKSMLSSDIKPSRLDQAKNLVNALADNLGENRLGMVVFAGQAALQMPLTDDIGSIGMFVNNAGPDNISLQGTEIGKALSLCNQSFNNSQEKKYKTVILISDGEDHDPSTDTILKSLVSSGVVVYTVGVGTTDGSPIIDPNTGEQKKDKDGNIVISKLNEKELATIANKTGGQYFHVTNEKDAAINVANAIDKMDKKLIETGQHPGEVNYKSFFPILVGLMLFLLVTELLMVDTKTEVAR